MLYCPPNITFTDIWVKHGISHCFLDTVTSSTYGLFMLLFGLGQWVMYRRYATPSESFIRPKSHLFRVQLALTAFLPVLAVIQLVLLATVVGDRTIRGFELVYFFSNLLVWPISIRLVLLERHYQLPTVPSNGHGLVLLLFWTLVFVGENLIFINLKNEDWWFDLSNASDKCEFALFVLRYVSSCLLFVIGIKAPGVAIDTANAPQLSPLLHNEPADGVEGAVAGDL